VTARIDLEREDGRHYPGDVVTGAVEWSLGAVPLKMLVRMGWRTEGKNWPADTGTVGEERFDAPRAVDRRGFRFTLPLMPYSYSGTVVSIVWRVELVARSSRLRGEKVEAFRIITMSPTGDAIDPRRT
jgi:hypothetical protein